MSDPWKVLAGFGGEKVVAVRPALIRLVGAPAAIWLSQALFYQRHFAKKTDGWFEVRLEQVEEETGLSAESQKSARTRLEKLDLLEQVRGAGNRLRCRVKLEALLIALESHSGGVFKRKAENQENPESDESRNWNDQNPENPETGESRFQNQDFTENQNRDNPDSLNKEEDLSLRPSFKTLTTTTDLISDGPSADSSQTEVAAVEVQKVIQTGPSSEIVVSPDGEVIQYRDAIKPQSQTRKVLSLTALQSANSIDALLEDGITRTGLEDFPGAASDDLERQRATDLLVSYLGGTQCRERYPRDHQVFLENHGFWLENRPPAFIVECIRLARNAKGVDKNPFGALVKWLENPVSAPDSARELQLRLERGLSAALERLPRRWYRTGDGLDIWVERWDKGDAVLEGGGRSAKATTRLWTLLPTDFAPEDAAPRAPAARAEKPRLNPELVAAGLEKLGIKPKTGDSA